MQTVRNRILLVKEESVYGSDSTPEVGSNAMEAKNVKVNYTGDKLTRDNVRSSISPVSPVMGKRQIEVSFEMEVKGSGSVGTAGKLGDLLEACGFNETIAGNGSSVVYRPASGTIKSVTIYVYDIDGASAVLNKITGAVGTFNLKCPAGQYASLEFNFKGKYNARSDVAVPSTPTYESTVPPIVESALFSLNSSNDLIAQECNIQMDNTLAERADLNSPSGILAFMITQRNPKGTFNPEAVLVATYDFTTDWASATQRALSITVGATAGNKVVITAPKVTIDSIGDGDRDSILTKDIPFTLGQNVGNDELVFNFQ